MDHQTERAYQAQKGVQRGLHKRVGVKKPGKGGVRYYKSVGLGFKTPREAIEGAGLARRGPGQWRWRWRLRARPARAPARRGRALRPSRHPSAPSRPTQPRGLGQP